MRKIVIIFILNILTILNINTFGELDSSVIEKVKLKELEKKEKELYIGSNYKKNNQLTTNH